MVKPGGRRKHQALNQPSSLGMPTPRNTSGEAEGTSATAALFTVFPSSMLFRLLALLIALLPAPSTPYTLPFGNAATSSTTNSSSSIGAGGEQNHRNIRTANTRSSHGAKMSSGQPSSRARTNMRRQRLPSGSSSNSRRGHVYGSKREPASIPPHRSSASAGGSSSSSSSSSSSARVKEGDEGGKDGSGGLMLERVKNIRDLGSVKGAGIVKGRVYRTGSLSEATQADADRLRDVTGLNTLIDLRSATELEKDKLIQADVYRGFESVGDSINNRNNQETVQTATITQRNMQGNQPGWSKTILREFDEGFLSGEEGQADPLMNGAGKTVDGEEREDGSKRRYFVSLIDESIYKKGVFQRLRRRHKAAVMALAPATMVSRRCTKKAKEIFMKEINAGGLVLLNELLLQYSGEGINRVLRLLATRERHPVALYCTAGKDRTGLVMALTLAALGVPDEAIVDDYAQSDAAYRELDDDDAMVGALAQEDLDPDIFLSAPRHVMEDILRFIRHKYGSVEGYLDSIGFDSTWRQRLRDALLVE